MNKDLIDCFVITNIDNRNEFTTVFSRGSERGFNGCIDHRELDLLHPGERVVAFRQKSSAHRYIDDRLGLRGFYKVEPHRLTREQSTLRATTRSKKAPSKKAPRKKGKPLPPRLMKFLTF